MKSFTFMFFVIAAFSFSFSSSAKESKLDQALAENPQAVETLVAYPAEVLQAILESSLYPETLSQIGQQQKQTSEQFQKLLAPYSRKTQEKVYNLARYPDLISALVEGGERSKGEIKNMSRDYPKTVQEAAQDLGRKEFGLLNNIHALYTHADQNFENQIRSLPSSSQSGYRTLLRYPEVLGTLSETPTLTLAMGEAYRTNPSATKLKLENLSTTVAQKNAEALNDYRDTLKNDPNAQKELKKSAQDFATQYGYEGNDYDYPPPSNYSDSQVVININPYPYWFGYPYWYSYPLWRPYPLWYMTGYYGYGWDGGYFAWGWPSYWYTNWFFGYPYNFYRYPYLASYYGNYYYRYRNYPINNGFYYGVRNWHQYNRNYISNDLWRYDNQRAYRWREYGQRTADQGNWRGGTTSPSAPSTFQNRPGPQNQDRFDRRQPIAQPGSQNPDRFDRARPDQFRGNNRPDARAQRPSDVRQNPGRGRPELGNSPQNSPQGRPHAGSAFTQRPQRPEFQNRGRNNHENPGMQAGQNRGNPRPTFTPPQGREAREFRGNSPGNSPGLTPPQGREAREFRGNGPNNAPGRNRDSISPNSAPAQVRQERGPSAPSPRGGQERAPGYQQRSGNQGNISSPASQPRGSSNISSGGGAFNRGSSFGNRGAGASWGGRGSFSGSSRSSFGSGGGGGFRGGGGGGGFSRSGFSRGR